MAIYLFRRTKSGLIKIGASHNPEWRRRDLHRDNNPVTLLATYESPDDYGDEQRLHLMFSAKRNEGEWFDLTSADLDTIAQYFKISRHVEAEQSAKVFYDQICKRCEYEWKSRKQIPSSCPRCKSYAWQTARKDPKQIADEVNAELIAGKGARETMRAIDQTAYEASKREELAEDWTGWSDERTTEDTERGETITYRQHLKSGRRKEIRRESSW